MTAKILYFLFVDKINSSRAFFSQFGIIIRTLEEGSVGDIFFPIIY